MSVSGINYIRNDRSEILWKARINNPDLDPSDRQLFQGLSNGEISKKEILNRYHILVEGMMKKYDGRLSTDNSRTSKRISAFEWVLDDLVGQGKISKTEFNNACEGIFGKYLKPEDKELIDEYKRSANRPAREREKARQAIIDRILSYQDAMAGTVWGTSSKIEAYQRSMALQNATPDSISADEVMIAMYLKVFDLPAEPPTEKEARGSWINSRDFIKYNILPLENAISSPEKSDDQEIKADIKDKIKTSYENLLEYLGSKELDAHDIDQARALAAIFIDFAGKTGISRKEIETIETGVEKSLPRPQVKQIELQKIKRPVVVTPDTLPRSVIHFLEKVKINGMSGYQFVKENVKFIILNPQIKSSGTDVITGAGGPLGVTTALIPVIEIDTYDESDKKTPRTALQLIDTIMHETFHVYWMNRHFNDPKMLSSAVNEGMANLAGYSAARQLREALFPDPKRDILLGDRSIENKNNIENDIKTDLATVGGAIQELGLDPEKVLEGIDIPKFLRASLKGDHENDLNTYPTLTPYMSAQSSLESLDLHREDITRLRPIFEEVIRGKGLLSLDEKKKSSVHKLLAKIDPRYGEMKYEEAIIELRKLYGYYAWKEMRAQSESVIRSARAQYKDISNKDIENWQNQSRKEIKESVQDVRSGKRDNLVLGVLVQIHTGRKEK
jgi:hypothetical protein